MLSCFEATKKLNELKTLRDGLAQQLNLSQTENSSEAKEEHKARARLIKIQLEIGITEMKKETGLEISVPNAKNPYREAMRAAGFPETHERCKEITKMTFNFEELIKTQVELYRTQNLPEWADDIEANQEELFAVLSNPIEQTKIKERIAFGMIPLIMPGKKVQQETWKKALINLKPVHIDEKKNIKFMMRIFMKDRVQVVMGIASI